MIQWIGYEVSIARNKDTCFGHVDISRSNSSVISKKENKYSVILQVWSNDIWWSIILSLIVSILGFSQLAKFREIVLTSEQSQIYPLKVWQMYELYLHPFESLGLLFFNTKNISIATYWWHRICRWGKLSE